MNEFYQILEAQSFRQAMYWMAVTSPFLALGWVIVAFRSYGRPRQPDHRHHTLACPPKHRHPEDARGQQCRMT